MVLVHERAAGLSCTMRPLTLWLAHTQALGRAHVCKEGRRGQ